MAWEDVTQFVAAADRSVSGNSGAIALGKSMNIGILIDVTAHSGTGPTADFTIEWSMDGIGFSVAQPVDSFTQFTTVDTKAIKLFTVKAPFFRLVWTLAGTLPHYTFTATRYAVGT